MLDNPALMFYNVLMTEKQKKITAICTIAGILLLLVSVVALIYNLVSLGMVNARRAELEQRSAELQALIESNDDEIAYRSTAEFIEKYAREYLNMKYEDEEVYQPS